MSTAPSSASTFAVGTAAGIIAGGKQSITAPLCLLIILMATPIAVAESPVGDHGRMLDHRAVDCSYDYCTDELNDCKTYCWGGTRYSCSGGREPRTTQGPALSNGWCTVFTCCVKHPPPSPPPPPPPPPPPSKDTSVARDMGGGNNGDDGDGDGGGDGGGVIIAIVIGMVTLVLVLVIVIVIVLYRKKERASSEAARAPAPGAINVATPTADAGNSVVEGVAMTVKPPAAQESVTMAKLRELKGLLDEGVLTQAEFDAQKEILLQPARV